MADQPAVPVPRPLTPPPNARREDPPIAETLPAPGACYGPQKELEVLIRARYPLIYVVSWEEERVEAVLADIAKKRNKKLLIWTCTQGLVKPGAEPQRGSKMGSGNTADPLSALDAVLAHVEPAIFLFTSHCQIAPNHGYPTVDPLKRRKVALTDRQNAA